MFVWGDTVKRSFLLMTIVLLCVLSAGCKQTDLPFTGYGYIRNLDGSYVSGVSVKLGLRHCPYGRKGSLELCIGGRRRCNPSPRT